MTITISTADLDRALRKALADERVYIGGGGNPLSALLACHMSHELRSHAVVRGHGAPLAPFVAQDRRP